ncbi:MAG: hypothetical protein Q4F65_01375 [Propionibacteriaceae bacterium]|nr:hypothetical protein [Propionibacteriaceae bacterium]
MGTDSEPRALSRRRLAAGAAWAAPAIVLAAGAPTQAASTVPCPAGALAVIDRFSRLTLNLYSAGYVDGFSTNVYVNLRNDSGLPLRVSADVRIQVVERGNVRPSDGPRVMGAVDTSWGTVSHSADKYDIRWTFNAQLPQGSDQEPDVAINFGDGLTTGLRRHKSSVSITIAALTVTGWPTYAQIVAQNPSVSFTPLCASHYNTNIATSPYRVQKFLPSERNPTFEAGRVGDTWDSTVIGNAAPGITATAPSDRNNGIF